MNVYSIRKQKDISIEQLSKKLEIRPYRLRQLEKFGFTIKAYRQPVDVEDIYKIAEVLEIDPLYIFTYPDEYDKDKPEEILSAEGVESAEVFKNHVVCELTPKRNKNGDLVIKFKVYGRAMKIILPGV
jgi:transcriptional regulator with XRE-family HTH domain